MNRTFRWILCWSLLPICTLSTQAAIADEPAAVAFGEGGQIKMLYDRRQRPQSIFVGDKLHIVYNANAKPSTKSKAKTRPMAITYDPATRKFTKPFKLGRSSTDHHDCPIIWADADHHLHVLYDCHKEPGVHLVSKMPVSIGSQLEDWKKGSSIAPKLSYPTVYQANDKQVIYYRTDGHTSSWTYRITRDNGTTWEGPTNDVTDMDCKGRLDWSSYHTKLISNDGKYLHVAFTSYDDVKTNPDPKRFYNPRYDAEVSNEWKYNLYYVRIDLESHDVTNFQGDQLETPIHIDQADKECRIWDTQNRGAGIPPTLIEDGNGNPAFLHVLSEDTTRHHNYYYYRWIGDAWKATRIASSNHQWNSCHLHRRKDNTLDAYLVRDEGYLDSPGYMDKHGGGRVEQWTSTDAGKTWKMARDLTPRSSEYAGWKFNNPRHATRPDGSVVDNILLFYGWKDSHKADSRAFLLHE